MGLCLQASMGVWWSLTCGVDSCEDALNRRQGHLALCRDRVRVAKDGQSLIGVSFVLPEGDGGRA